MNLKFVRSDIVLPYDALTDEEKLTISYYLAVVGGSNSAPLDQVLSVWNKNKIKLFKALGNKLRVSIPVTLPRDMKSLNRELSFIYLPYTIWYETDRAAIKDNKDIIKQHSNNEFIADVLYFWVNQNYCLTDLSILSRLFRHDNISKGYISSLTNDDAYHFKDFKCTVKNGMKTIRTLQKVLQATHYPNLNLFEDWKNSINKLSATQDIHTNLVISISPLDFMTMSDNACNWSSCMSWSKDGCYRAGTLEMMNSNLTVVAYLEGPTEYKLDISETESYKIPNKSWRSLFYIHKNILLSGKSYPYHNEQITKLALRFLKDLVKENLKWDYQFGIQEYRDTEHIDNNFYMRDWYEVNHDHKPHHCIFVYTNGMYNDIIESKDPAYYCYRNYVPNSIKLCLSGPATCICCGKVIREGREICDYDELGRMLICDDCIRNRVCRRCNQVNYYSKYHTIFGTFCSDDCCKDMIYFPKFTRIASKEKVRSSDQYNIALFADEEININDLYNIREEFEVQDRINNLNDFIKKYRADKRFRLYKVPEKLSGYGFVNFYSREATIYTRPRYNGCSLYIYTYNNLNSNYTDLERLKKEIRKIENRIENTFEQIPLLDYLKGGYLI